MRDGDGDLSCIEESIFYPVSRTLQAGCHKDCLKNGVERCVVGWSDGSCGGQPRGRSTPQLERERTTIADEGDRQ
jgi:hypothetical protein